MLFDDLLSILAAQDAANPLSRRQIFQLPALALLASPALRLGQALAADGPIGPQTPAATRSSDDKKTRLFVAGGARSRDVKAVLEARGKLILRGDKKKKERIPMEVKGELDFAERFLSDKGDHAIRYYDKAQAQIRIGDGGVKPRLRDNRRIIVAKNSEQLNYRAPQGPMQRMELDLLRTQGDPLVLAELLPAEPVGIGDSWTPSPSTWAKVMALESVSQSDIKLTLSQREATIAMIDFSGLIDGAVGGVATEIRIRGKMNVDTKINEITWFAISTKEKRSISPAEPGVEADGRLRVAIKRAAKTHSKLAESAVAGLPTDVGPATGILEFESQKIGFSIVHDPRWRLMFERPDVAIMRMVSDGDMLAQCSISRLTPRPIEKPFGVVDFQRDIQLALDKNFGQFLETQQYEAENGQKVIRVTASGIASEIPIHWIYFHVTGSQGDRLSLVFTLDAKLVERFGGADRTFVNGLEIKPAPAPRPASGSGSQTSP